MRISRQEYWGGLPFPTLGDLPNSGMEPRSPALQADSLLTEPPGSPTELLQHAAVENMPQATRTGLLSLKEDLCFCTVSKLRRALEKNMS